MHIYIVHQSFVTGNLVPMSKVAKTSANRTNISYCKPQWYISIHLMWYVPAFHVGVDRQALCLKSMEKLVCLQRGPLCPVFLVVIPPKKIGDKWKLDGHVIFAVFSPFREY